MAINGSNLHIAMGLKYFAKRNAHSNIQNIEKGKKSVRTELHIDMIISALIATHNTQRQT